MDGGLPGGEEASHLGGAPQREGEPREAATKEAADDEAGEGPASAAGRCGPGGRPREPTPEPPISVVRQMD